jgi:26 proteasome complex subunit DSS1
MSTVKNNTAPKDTDTEKPKETVAPLEEDDEFEDFPVEGSTHVGSHLLTADWTEAESQSQYTKPIGGEAAQPLWAEEWEDDTEETDFAIQLR